MLNNKKDAIYYSGPFSCSEKAVTLNVGEVYKVHGVNGTIASVASGDSSKVTAAVSGNEVTLTGVATATSAVTVTLTDSNGGTTTVSVSIV